MIKLGIFLSILFLSAPSAIASGSLGKFYATFYYILDETQYAPGQDQEIKDVSGQVLALVSNKFKRDLDIEGTGILRDGRTITFDRIMGQEVRYKISPHHFGSGVGNCPLQPYKTIAVDPRVIRLGSKVFISKLKGMKLPDGSLHDGVFIAEDVGSAIQGRHLDFFSMIASSSSKPFHEAGVHTKTFVEVELLSVPEGQTGCHLEDPGGSTAARRSELALQMKALLFLYDKYLSLNQEQVTSRIRSRLNSWRLRWEWMGSPLTSESPTTEMLSEFEKEFGITPPVAKMSKFSRAFDHSQLGEKEILLTVGGLASPDIYRSIASYLKTSGISAVFFVPGSVLRTDPNLGQELVAEGHPLGNESVFRPQYTKLITEAIATELAEADSLISRSLGALSQPTNFYRAPYLMIDSKVSNAFNSFLKQSSQGHLLNWNIELFDWLGGSSSDALTRSFKQLNQMGKGIVVVDVQGADPARLTQSFVASALSQGYRFINTNEIFKKRSQRLPKRRQ
ncbi:MAG: polysaccharide deacetylase family protein [Oligoflexia bacterium]|nr:polysaccharide deacetylase family protein [Oligoflexia bacterium]